MGCVPPDRFSTYIEGVEELEELEEEEECVAEEEGAEEKELEVDSGALT